MSERSLAGRKVLVTGAGGFLAQYIVPRLLAGGADVTGIDLKEVLDSGHLSSFRNKIELMECDVTDYDKVMRLRATCDYVIHLAAIAAPMRCEKEPHRAFLVNVQGTFNMLRFARDAKARKFAFASSAHVYGISPKYMPTDEKHPLALQDIYTTTKILGESLCQLFYSNHNLQYVATRLFNGYGPGQSEDYFIPAMISKAKQGRIELRGRNITKDFVYAEDVAEAYHRALTSDYVGEINIGSGRQTTLEYIARRVADAFGADLSFAAVDPGGPTHMQCDISRAQRVLGWTAEVSVEEGLERTILATKAH